MEAAAVIAGWGTVGGGLVLAALWVRAGGARPRDRREHVAATPTSSQSTDRPASRNLGDPSAPEPRNALGIVPPRPKAFTSPHVALHGLLGIVGVILLTYAASGAPDAPGQALGVTLGVLVIAAALGSALLVKWRQAVASGDDAIPERSLPPLVVAVHGLAAVATIALAVALLVTT